MFVDFFIRRPVFATVCAILITLVGAVSIPTLPIAQYPTLALPQVSVSSYYTGASAEIVESAVTTPLELAINGVPGMKHIDSTSGSDGVSTVSVTFDVGRDVDLAAVDVQNRVNSALGRLPNEVKQTGVSISKNSGSFVLAAALFTDDGRYDQKFISNYADVFLRDALCCIAGVSDVEIFGERKLDADLARSGAAGGAAAHGGRRGRRAARAERAGRRGRRRAPAGAERAELSVHRPRQGAAHRGERVRGRDPPRRARRHDGAAARRRARRARGRELRQLPPLRRQGGVGARDHPAPGANALDVAERVKAELARLSKAFPPGLRYQVAFDTTLAVSESIHEVLTTLAEAIVLVILVIFVFLQSFRVTLIPAVTIPVSLIGTFAFVKLFGFSINTLTLFGITLATGLVVDDAIVVIENVSRFIEEKGLSPRQAASEGVSEVIGAVIATSLVLVAVFVPVAFFPGTTGAHLPAVLADDRLLRRHLHVQLAHALPGPRRALAARRARAQGLVLPGRRQRARDAPARLRARARLPPAAAGARRRRLPRQPRRHVRPGEARAHRLRPRRGSGLLHRPRAGPRGQLAHAHRGRRQAGRGRARHPAGDLGTFSVGGFSFGGSGSNKAILFVNLRPWGERRGEAHALGSVISRLRGPLSAIAGAEVIAFAPPSIDGVGNLGGFQFELEDQTGSGKLDDLAKMTEALIAAGRTEPKLRDVFSTFTANDPQIVVEVDRNKAKALGVTVSDVFTTLQVFMGSQYVNDFDFNNRTYRVYVQADQPFRANPKDLERFYVRTGAGAMVPLASLIRTTSATTASVINHYNLFRSTELSGSPAEGVSSGEALLAMEEVARKALPHGASFEWSGISKEQIESGGKATLIFALSLLFVFLVLAAQYESFALPAIVILAVPMAVLGALGAQLVRGYSNDVFCQIGLVMLIGLSSKNAILIVEFAHQLRQRGQTILEAAVEAAETRLRPILMTSLAFLLGTLPLLVATGAGSGSRRSLGTAVFGGMLVSTVLNLFFIPVLYVLLETARERLFHKKPLAVRIEG